MGKSTLIKGLQDRLGYHLVVHYEKPKLLECYEENSDWPLKAYQEASFDNMFRMLSGTMDVICDRAHLGEFVYSPMYRNYDGSYVFEQEKGFVSYGSKFHEQTTLVLLTTDNFDFITDDGMSFDFSKKEIEQNQFIKAFERSIIKRKLIINVHNGHGGYKTPATILDEVLR